MQQFDREPGLQKILACAIQAQEKEHKGSRHSWSNRTVGAQLRTFKSYFQDDKHNSQQGSEKFFVNTLRQAARQRKACIDDGFAFLRLLTFAETVGQPIIEIQPSHRFDSVVTQLRLYMYTEGFQELSESDEDLLVDEGSDDGGDADAGVNFDEAFEFLGEALDAGEGFPENMNIGTSGATVMVEDGVVVYKNDNGEMLVMSFDEDDEDDDV